ncbi:MAG: uncharacterized protein QOE65_2639 [Solirubrobacteraceae bacterium]|nr:uncharacterized protein [Solirubrobacteraceae bacterium]
MTAGRNGAQAYVAVLKVELHFPEAGSLKARRRELAPVKAYVQRLGGTVAEAGPHDRWQLATVVAAFTAGSPGRLDEVCDRLEGWLDARFPSGVTVQKTVNSLRDLLD